MSWQDRIALAEQTNAPFGVGTFRPGVTLLIGEQASRVDMHTPQQRPFCSDKGCSGWLNKQLASNSIQDDGLFWVNALNNDGSAIDLQALVAELQPTKIIALGGVARNLCKTSKVEHVYVYHPQYWKRFKSKQRYPLLDELSESF